MDKIREYLSKPLITGVIGFILGLIIGLPVLGWGLFPVQWTDASPEALRKDARQDYLRMAIESFAKNPDSLIAQQRWNELGKEGSQTLESLKTDSKVNQQELATFSGAVQAATSKPAETKEGGVNPVVLLGVFCLLTLIIGGALVYVLVLRKRQVPASSRETANVGYEQEIEQPEKTNFSAQGQEAPVAQFMTTYMAGDDLYDDSFSIDSPTGEFLGECGVGISDTIGVGDPKKVTAFEVWLFDKNDIQTVTKVLMSAHAFDDQTIRQRLASKGEPVMVEAGKRILLETATLQLEARVVDMNYGQGALPANSFFERMTLELAVWPKPKA